MVMPKPRKMLGDWKAPYIQLLMRLIETQSKTTNANWRIAYAEEYILEIFEKSFPDDNRPRKAIAAARDWLDGKIKLPVAKKLFLTLMPLRGTRKQNLPRQPPPGLLDNRPRPSTRRHTRLVWRSTVRRPLPTIVLVLVKKRKSMRRSLLRNVPGWRTLCALLPWPMSPIRRK